MCSWGVLREGTGDACDGGFPLGVVDPGPPIDTFNGLGVLAPHPVSGWGVLFVGLWMTSNISLFQKSSLKYARSAFSLSMMSKNEALQSSTVLGMYLG